MAGTTRSRSALTAAVGSLGITAKDRRRVRLKLDPAGHPPLDTMTYCVGVKLDEGPIFASDSRTHAGVDNYAKFCKMTVFERAGDRVLVLLSAVHCRAARSQACRTARLNRSQALCG